MADPSFKNPLVLLPTIGGISIDYTERLGESYSNMITDNPVEGRTSSSDYVVNKPTVINFVGEFTDFPSTNLYGSFASFQFSGQIKFDKLLKIKAGGDPFPVLDGRHYFPAMQFLNLDLIQEDDEFKTRFSATLKEIQIESSTVQSSDVTSGGRFTTMVPAPVYTGYLATV